MDAAAFTLPLPADYDAADALAFHARDPEGRAERVEHGDAGTGARIRKGVVLDGVATVIDIALEDGAARCTIDADADADTDAGQGAHAGARAAIAGMLGLRIDPAPFVQAVAGDALLGPVVRRRPGLRVIQSATVFEALTWAIIGQQINLPFAIALRRTFIEQAGRVHASGLWCYPDAADVARLDSAQLTSRKFSRAKAETLLRLARLVAEGALDLSADPAGVGAQLLAVKGIGPWTVNYAMLRGWGHSDCSLHGDVAVRSAIGRLTGGAKPGLQEAEAFLLNYRPHRTLAAAHLWASLAQATG